MAYHNKPEEGPQGLAEDPEAGNFSKILDIAPDAMIVVNREGRIAVANEHAARLLGYKREDFLGLSVEQLIPERFRAGHRERRRAYFQNPVARPMGHGLELCALRKDGTELPVEISLNPLQTGNGLLVSAAIRDIRDRTRVERELRTLAQEQAAVARLGQLALSGSDLGPLMDEAAEVVARTLEVEYCKVLELLPDGENLLLRAGIGWKEGYVGHAIVGAGADSQAGYTLLSHEPVVVEDMRTEKRFSGPPLLTEHGVVSGLSVIILGPLRPFGILGAHTSRRRVFSKDDINFLQAVANVLATAIERKRAEEAVRESEERFRTVVTSGPVGIALADARGGILSSNPQFQELLGYSQEELEGMSFQDVTHPDDLQASVSLFQELVEGKRDGFSLEKRYIRKDGSIRTCQTATSAVRDLEGNFRHNIGMITDLTARRRAEEALRESEERFRQMADHIQEVYWMTDATGSEVLYVNPAYEQIWGRSCQSLYEHPLSWVEAIHPDDRERVLRGFRTGLVKGEYKAEFRIVRPDGSIRHIWDRSFPIPDERGNILRVVGIAEDITHRKQAEEAIRFRAQIIDQIHDAVISTDLEGHVTSWNKGAERLYGFSAEEAMGRHISFVYSEEQYIFLQQGIIAPLKEKGSHETEVRLRRKSGEEFFAHLSTSLLRDNQGLVSGMIGYVMDITAQTLAREKLQESEEKYRELAESVTDVFYEMDRDLRYTYWNRASENLTGISAKDAIGKSLYDLFPDVKGSEAEKMYLETLRTGQPRSFVNRYDLHGKEFLFDLNVYPSKRGLSVFAKDITERIRTEEALKQANEALRVEIGERVLAEQMARTQSDFLLAGLRQISVDPDLDKLVGVVLCAVARLFGAHSSALWIYHPETQTTSLEMTCLPEGSRCRSLAGTQQWDHPNAARPVTVAEGSRLEAFYSERKPFVFEGLPDHPLLEPDVRRWAGAQGLKSVLAVPLLFGGEAIGVLTVRDKIREHFTRDEIRLAQTLSYHLIMALKSAHLAEQGKQTAVLEERNRMAREIHDTLAQSLAGIVLQLEAAEDIMSANPKRARAHLTRARTLARESLGEARRSVWALRPRILESGDLPAGLRQVTERLTAQAKVKTRFALYGTPWPLPADVEDQLFRIGQEAVTNALKHARAKRIRVELRYEPDKVSLLAEDDGKGFDPEASVDQWGFGLVSMRERAAQIGAKVIIQSKSGKGTQVRVELPAPAGAPNDVPNQKGKAN